MRLLFISIASRNIANWMPGLELLEKQGVEIAFQAFPQLWDPDAARVSEYLKGKKHQILPIADKNKAPLLSPSEIKMAMKNYFLEFMPDVVLLATCHVFPEIEFIKSISMLGKRPVVIGLQHGFYQTWEDYVKNPCFDYFFCYGDMFFYHFPDAMRPALRAVGLPKLDLIRPAPVLGEDIVFLAQCFFDPEVIREFLRNVRDHTGLSVRIRSHPEHYNHYSALADEFAFDPPEVSVVESITKACRVLAEPSTAVLETLAVRRPVAILPYVDRDFDFRRFGFVIGELRVDEAEHVWNRCLNNPDFADDLKKAICGTVVFDASALFVDTIKELLENKNTRPFPYLWEGDYAESVVIFDGDSVTEGMLVAAEDNRPSQTENLLYRPVSSFNFGVSGETIMSRLAHFEKNILANYNPAAKHNIISLLIGSNDILSHNQTAEATWERIATYCKRAKALGFKVVLGTLLPFGSLRDGERTPTEEQYVQMKLLCDKIRENPYGTADVIIDYAAHPIMGPLTAVTDKALYIDQVHPTALGYSYLAAMEAITLNSLLA